jgi:aspartokinase
MYTYTQVSAMGKTTDGLIEVVELACRRDFTYLGKVDLIKQKHLDTLVDLVPGASPADVAIRSEVTHQHFSF